MSSGSGLLTATCSGILVPARMESHRSSSHEQKIPEMSLEHMERAMQAPGFIARRFGEPCLKILYGLVRGHHSDQTLLSGGKSLEVRKFFRRGQNLADNTKRAKPLIQKCFRVISKKRRVGLRQRLIASGLNWPT